MKKPKSTERTGMMTNETDILTDVSPDFNTAFLSLAERVNFSPGEYVFHQGDRADFLYLLDEGEVALRLFETDDWVYWVRRAGEFFGLSSLLTRITYSSSAQCMQPSLLRRFTRNDVEKLIQIHSSDGLIVYRNLSEILQNRLLRCYDLLTEKRKPEKVAEAKRPFKFP